LSPNCTHIKNHGGLKKAIRFLKKSLYPGYFFARFDIQSYYRSMDHKVLLKILHKNSTPIGLTRVISLYAKSAGFRGIPAGGALSPLLGAIYLDPLDKEMDFLSKQNKIVYIRYMDDYVLVARSRWHLKKAIKRMYQTITRLNLVVHPDKKMIGRVEKGIHFLGYSFHPKRQLRASPEALTRFTQHISRLYEQGASATMLWQYTERWSSWLFGGVADLVSHQGGTKRYFYTALKRSGIRNIKRPMSTGFT